MKTTINFRLMKKRYYLWEGTPDPTFENTDNLLWETDSQFDGSAEELQAEIEKEKARLELENPGKVYTIIVESAEMDYNDEPDPEEQHWKNVACHNERFSDHGNDY